MELERKKRPRSCPDGYACERQWASSAAQQPCQSSASPWSCGEGDKQRTLRVSTFIEAPLVIMIAIALPQEIARACEP